MDLNDNVDKVASHLERANFGAYADLITRPWKFFWLNFIAGLFRGFGLAVGMTVIFAVALYLLAAVLKHFIDVPVLGSFIADLVDFVNSSANTRIRY